MLLSAVLTEPTLYHWAKLKFLNWDLKDSPRCLDLAYYQPQNKIEK